MEGALAIDHYLTERVTLFTEKTLYLFRGAMLEGVHDVSWVDGLQVGTFPLHDVVASTK